MQTVSKITMQDSAKLFARITGAPRPHRATMLRWALKGVRGTRLRAERLGGRWYTTPEAVEDFLRLVNTLPDDTTGRTAGPVRAAQVQRAIDDLDRKIAPKRPGRKPLAK
jgi:hypothetical protein